MQLKNYVLNITQEAATEQVDRDLQMIFGCLIEFSVPRFLKNKKNQTCHQMHTI